MLVTFVSAALALLAVIVPTASDGSALSISSPPGSMRKKTKAIIGPNMRDSPASRFTDIVPMFEPPLCDFMGRIHWVQHLVAYTLTPKLWHCKRRVTCPHHLR